MRYKSCASQEEAVRALESSETTLCRVALYPVTDAETIALSFERLVATALPACFAGTSFRKDSTIATKKGSAYMIAIARPLVVVENKLDLMRM